MEEKTNIRTIPFKTMEGIPTESPDDVVFVLPNGYDKNQSADGIIIDEPIVVARDGFWKGLHFFGFGKLRK